HFPGAGGNCFPFAPCHGHGYGSSRLRSNHRMEAVRQTVQQADTEEIPASFEAAMSAWVDGEEEIRTEDVDTPYGRHLWETYHLIGDVMRNESLAIRP